MSRRRPRTPRRCPIGYVLVTATARRVYCTPRCRQVAWERRHGVVQHPRRPPAHWPPPITVGARVLFAPPRGDLPADAIATVRALLPRNGTCEPVARVELAYAAGTPRVQWVPLSALRVAPLGW